MKLTWLSIFICVWNAIVSTQNQVLNERDSHRLRILLDNKEELKEPILTQAMAVAETHVPNALIETSDGTDKSSAKPLHRVYDPVSGLFCELIGDCHTCPLSEKDEIYCRETGHRQELSCPFATTPIVASHPSMQTTPEIRFKACTPTDKGHPLWRVVSFEVLYDIIMAMALTVSYYFLRKERRKHLSLFDLRKADPRQRTSLLNSSTLDKNDD